MMGGNAAYRSKFFALAQQRARRVLKDPQALIQLARKAEGKAADQNAGPLSGVLGELKALLRLIRAYAKGEYRQVSWESMVIAVGAVLYVVSPIDVIPDFILGGGFLDDASVLAFAYRKIHKEVDDFLEWEQANTPELEAPELEA
ncbi:MAG: YkvA family protein [Acidimicrobiia bacterium]